MVFHQVYHEIAALVTHQDLAESVATEYQNKYMDLFINELGVVTKYESGLKRWKGFVENMKENGVDYASTAFDESHLNSYWSS